jgi:hypothetical protein
VHLAVYFSKRTSDACSCSLPLLPNTEHCLAKLESFNTVLQLVAIRQSTHVEALECATLPQLYLCVTAVTSCTAAADHSNLWA